MDDLVKQGRAVERDLNNGFPMTCEKGRIIQQMADSIDALAAKLADVEADRRFILEERDRTFALMLARAEAAEARMAHLENHIEAVAKDTHKIMVAYEAAIPAVYRLAMEAAAKASREWGAQFEPFGHPAMGDDEIKLGASSHVAASIRALPTPTAAELMARINEGEK